jgi:hypothetical protein
LKFLAASAVDGQVVFPAKQGTEEFGSTTDGERVHAGRPS